MPIEEKIRICKAIDAFAEEMKVRMLEKAEEGLTGWDTGKYSVVTLHDKLLDKGVKIVAQDLKCDEKHFIDVANLAMILSLLNKG